MTTVIPAEGLLLDRILETTDRVCHEGLSLEAYRRFDAAQLLTAWGRCHQRRFALMEGPDLLASAKQYDFAGILDGRPVRVCGVGAVFTVPSHRGRGHARALVERLLDAGAKNGADLALLSCPAAGWERHGFDRIPIAEMELAVTQSPRRGAPMTPLRVGEERDLAAIAAMGQVRSAPFRFHLDRDIDLIRYAITKKRLLAGLGPSGAQELQFFIAEEGITAAAYVVLSVSGSRWTIEECGDRDPSGARVGAILQALIAREPTAHPSIHGCLPPGFVPPQVTIVSAAPTPQIMLVRPLSSAALRLPLAVDDVMYWRSDAF